MEAFGLSPGHVLQGGLPELQHVWPLLHLFQALCGMWRLSGRTAEERPAYPQHLETDSQVSGGHCASNEPNFVLQQEAQRGLAAQQLPCWHSGARGERPSVHQRVSATLGEGQRRDKMLFWYLHDLVKAPAVYRSFLQRNESVFLLVLLSSHIPQQ